MPRPSASFHENVFVRLGPLICVSLVMGLISPVFDFIPYCWGLLPEPSE